MVKICKIGQNLESWSKFGKLVKIWKIGQILKMGQNLVKILKMGQNVEFFEARQFHPISFPGHKK